MSKTVGLVPKPAPSGAKGGKKKAGQGQPAEQPEQAGAVGEEQA